MVHMDEEGEIERTGRQPRIVRIAAHEGYQTGQTLARDSPGKPLEILRNDIFGEDMPLGFDPPGQAHRVIAAPGADIGYGQTGGHAQQVHHALGLARLVARLLVMPDVGDDPGDRPARRWKRACRRSWWR